MYFKKFDKIQYGFDKENFKSVTDIMKRVKVRDKVLDNITLYDKYDVVSGETPETIAFKFGILFGATSSPVICTTSFAGLPCI